MLGKSQIRSALLGLSLLWLLVVGLAQAAPPPARRAAHAAPALSADTATVVLNPLADSYVNLNSSSNFGSAAELRVEYNPAGPSYSRSLIQFSMADLAYQLPAGATVLSATLKLHLGADAPITETITVHTGSGPEWGEDTVNWASQPAWGPPGVALSVSPGHGDKVWDVTPLLQGWLNGSLANRGLGLLGPESGPDAYSFVFDSRTGTNAPQLAVTYQLPAPTAVPPTQIPIPPHPPVAGPPKVVLSNDTASAGAQLRITGFDFSSDLCSRYDTFLVQGGLSKTTTLVGSVAPLEGDVTTLVFTVPVDAKGNNNLVTLGAGYQATTQLSITPTVVLAASQPMGPALPPPPSATLIITPTSGPPGTQVTVSGFGFTGGGGCATVNLVWQSLGPNDTPVLQSLGNAALAGSTFNYRFAAPYSSDGDTTVMAVGPNNTVATATFTVCCRPTPPPPPNPVTVSLCAVANDSVHTWNPDQANSSSLNIGYTFANAGDNSSLSLLRFDLSAIPVGATVNAATLKLIAPGSNPASGLNPAQIGVFELDPNISWTESESYNQLNQFSPWSTRELSRRSVGNSAGAAYTWDVAAAAQDWVNAPGTNAGLSVENVGLPIQGQTFSRAFVARQVGSPDCPQLTITYDPSSAGPDLYVGAVDLIQANGNLTPYALPYATSAQTVPFGASPVAGKTTLLRVFAGTTSLLSQVTGAVTGYTCGSNAALAGSPLAPVDGAIIAVPNPSPSRRSAGLNFVLPSNWLTGCIDLSIRLTSLGEFESPNKLANNTTRWNGITFRPTQTLNLVLIPLYSNVLGTYAPASPQYVGPILAWVNSVFPLADGDIRYWTTPLQIYNQTIPADGGDLLDDLEGIRDSISGMPANTRFLGLVPGNLGGMARNGGRTTPTAGNLAYASSTPINGSLYFNNPEFYGSVWAQEIAHLFGRMHASDAHQESSGGPVDCQYPSYGAYFNHGGIGSYGVAFNTEDWNQTSTNYPPNDFIPPGTAASHTHDFMSYGNFPRWVSPYTFNALARAFNYLPPLSYGSCPGSQVQAQASPAAATLAQPTAPAAVDLIRLSGHIHPNHTVVWHAAFHSQDVAPALGTDGDYSLELRDITGTVLISDTFSGEHSTHVDTGSVTFSRLLPWQPGTARIVLKHHNFVLAEQVVSSNAPTVTITAPTGGASIGSQLTVQWLGSDPDGGTLAYAVLYNTGTNGEWWPIVTGITATAGTPLSYTVATDLLAGSTLAHVKVLVSDGIHSGESTSAAFSLPKKAPTVAILTPLNNSELLPGGDDPLLGAAYDAQDGSLSGAALVWTSDRDGVLGQGSHLHVHLSGGTHQLTLTATDADGQHASASVTVRIQYNLYLPTVRR